MSFLRPKYKIGDLVLVIILKNLDAPDCEKEYLLVQAVIRSATLEADDIGRTQFEDNTWQYVLDIDGYRKEISENFILYNLTKTNLSIKKNGRTNNTSKKGGHKKN